MAVLAVQRFVVMSDLPVSKSDEHENIGEQLSWAMGSFGLAPALGVSSSWLPGKSCLLYTSPSPRDEVLSRMPSSA